MRVAQATWLAWAALALSGCATLPTAGVTNPIFVASSNQEYVWERTVDALHAFHFPIRREDRLSGVIETGYLVGAGLLEPWHHDSVGLEQRLESSFQSIRRKVLVNVVPVEGGYLVGVQALKEREDAPAAMPNAPGIASFSDRVRLTTDFTGRSERHLPASTWVPLGRDPALEQALLVAIQQRLTQ